MPACFRYGSFRIDFDELSRNNVGDVDDDLLWHLYFGGVDDVRDRCYLIWV